MSSSGESSDSQVVHLLQPSLSTGASIVRTENSDMLPSAGGAGAMVCPVGGASHLILGGGGGVSHPWPHDHPTAESLPQPDSASSSSSSSSQQYTVEEQVTTVRIPMRRPNSAFLEIIQEAGADGEVFTMREIIHHVKNYIIRHQLFDRQDPRIVHCRSHRLGTVFGVDQFTIHEAVPLFMKHSFPVLDSCIRIRRQLVRKTVNSDGASAAGDRQDGSGVTSTVSSTTGQSDGARQEGATAAGVRRGEGEGTGSSGGPTPQHHHHHHPSPGGNREKAEAGPYDGGRGTSVNIVYGDEVDGASPLFKLNMASSSQASPLPASQMPEEDSVSVQYDSDHFAVEYELESSGQHSESELSSHGTTKDFVVVQKESDVEFWADYSDTETNSDTELGDADQWQCEACRTLNIPFYRYCGRCWALRPGWLPDASLPPPSSSSSSTFISTPTSSSHHLPPLPSGAHPHLHGYYRFPAQSSNDEEQMPGSSQGSLQRQVWLRQGDRGRRRRIRIMSASSSERSSESLVSLSDEEDEATPSTSQADSVVGASDATNALMMKGERGEEPWTGRQEARGSSIAACVVGSGANNASSAVGERRAEDRGSSVAARVVVGRGPNGEGREETRTAWGEGRGEGREDSGVSSVSHSQELLSTSQETETSVDTKGRPSETHTTTTVLTSAVAAIDAEMDGPRCRGVGGGGKGKRRRAADKCIMCDSRHKTGCIIHGSSGHQICCYRCAKRLWREGQPCPICRKPIQKVIRNFVL